MTKSKREELHEKLSNECDMLIALKLNQKEMVLYELYSLAEHMYEDGDCRALGWMEIVSNAIEYITLYCTEQ